MRERNMVEPIEYDDHYGQIIKHTKTNKIYDSLTSPAIPYNDIRTKDK